MLKKILLFGVAIYVLQSVATVNVVWKQQQEILDMESYVSEMEDYVVECSDAIADILADMAEEQVNHRYYSVPITDEDKTLLALCIYHEARGESFEGQRAVAEVILNRVLSEKWPNTIKEVINDEGQFDCASYLLTADIKDPGALSVAYRVIDYVLTYDEYIFDANMGYFRSTPYTSCSYEQIGNHYFAHM